MVNLPPNGPENKPSSEENSLHQGQVAPFERRPIDLVLHNPYLRKLKSDGHGGWTACCPAHNDENPSLSISEGDDGRVLLYCHAGCSFANVVDSLGLEQSDCFPNGSRRNGSTGKKKSQTNHKAPKPKAQDQPATQPKREYRDFAHFWDKMLNSDGCGSIEIDQLAWRLRVHPDALNALDVVYRPPGSACDGEETRARYLFPERDATGKVIGVDRRYEDGNKSCIPGSRRGLTYADGWDKVPGDIYIPEGAGDVAAIMTLGLSAIGRPNCCIGAEMLAEMLATHAQSGRRLIIVSDNDQAGRNGARSVAQKLANAVGIVVYTAPTPDGVKDARDWLRAQRSIDGAHTADIYDEADMDRCRENFTQKIGASLQAITPEEKPAQIDGACDGTDATADGETETRPLTNEDCAAALGPDPSPEELREEMEKWTKWKLKRDEQRVVEALEKARWDLIVYPCHNCYTLQLAKADNSLVLEKRCGSPGCPGCRLLLNSEWRFTVYARLSRVNELFVIRCTRLEWEKAFSRAVRRAGGEHFLCYLEDENHFLAITDAAVSGSKPISRDDAIQLLKDCIENERWHKRHVWSSSGWGKLKDDDENGPQGYRLMHRVPSPLNEEKFHEVCDANKISPKDVDVPPEETPWLLRKIKFSHPRDWDWSRIESVHFQIANGEALGDLRGVQVMLTYPGQHAGHADPANEDLIDGG
jgi:hypothetical protein